MPYADARQFLQALEGQGDLAHVGAKVDLDVEVGGICRKALDGRAPTMARIACQGA